MLLKLNRIKPLMLMMAKGSTKVSITDEDSVKLFTESYNGKGPCSKKITIPQDIHTAVVKIEQGNEIELGD